MNIQALAIVALMIILFGAVSGRLQRSIITPPMVFVVFGMIAHKMHLVEFHIEDEFILILAELTLMLVLFSDASRIHLDILSRYPTVPMRLLGIGMPLTIILGTGAAMLLFKDLSFAAAAVLATILAPTDAALGQAVVSDERVPVRVRQGLNVESGLNDGISVPVVLFFLALTGEHAEPTHYWVQFAAGQIILGPLAGILVGYLGGQIIQISKENNWMNHAFEQLSTLALALLAFAIAELIGGNGFISTFVAGLTVGNTAHHIRGSVYEFVEVEGQLLTLLKFLVYGAIMVFPALDVIDGTILLYAILSLTVIRMIPVAISLLGMGLQTETILFFGWFGPRGIASILLGLVMLEHYHGEVYEEIFTVVIATVLISVFAHGLTAVPAVNKYSSHAHKIDAPEAEHAHVEEMPIRHPH